MLFHFSEKPNIKEFIPRSTDGMPPVVWAIDEEHAVNYFFPRDCPRVIYSRSDNISLEDKKLFFSHTSAKTIIAVETAWLERIRNTTIYKYTFDNDGFTLVDEIAGYYINHSTVLPITVEPITDLIEKITSMDVDFRITPNLFPLRDAIISSTIDNFSIIRFRNANQ